jgi:hypothetical protein
MRDMKKIAGLLLVLYSPAVFAQDKTQPPPMVGGKPLVQVKPKATASKGSVPKAKPQSVAARLQACLDIDDETKERLTCYDAVFPPKPKPKPPTAKGVNDCTAFKEEDERLRCFNGFADKIPKLPQ